MQPAKFLVTFVRHGETFMNSKRLIQGHTDSALSDIGIEQAKVLGRAITSTTFTRAYSSDLQRAYNTANLILGELKTSSPDVIKHVGLRERCYGEAEGKPAQEFIQEAAKVNVSAHEYTPTGGESPQDLNSRVSEFFKELCKLSETTTLHENILVVSHGGWIQALMKYLHSGRNEYELKNFNPSNAIRIHYNTGVTIMSITPPVPNKNENPKYVVEVLKMNNASHLSN
ncbi:unnamed protein product [Orchesella dallaii]|uniref:Fructose-2,6-bisphosphatase TIGAR n=1 Tax=Orchesella dallaii TaxID=48710 RepID=A0ABP1RTG6_9HEXA